MQTNNSKARMLRYASGVGGQVQGMAYPEGTAVGYLRNPRVCQANCVTRFFIAHSSARVLRRTSP
ncbi:hypothetical protein, partial [Xanthomonas oryzae]